MTAPHVADYLARVDAHLPGLPAGERRAFLAREREKWLARYEGWIGRVDAGDPTDPDVKASDFLETLGAIETRAAQQREGVPA